MQAPAPVKQQMLDSRGVLTVPWVLFFQALVGTINTLESEVTTLQTQIAALNKKVGL